MPNQSNQNESKPDRNRPGRNNRPPRRPARSNLAQQAQRNAWIGLMPGLNQINRDWQENIDSYENMWQGAGSIFDALQDKLAVIPGQYSQMTAGIAPALQGQLDTLAQSLGGLPNMPASEALPAATVFGVTGANALSDLASHTQRMAGYGESAAREGLLSEKYAKTNLMSDLQDELRNTRDRRLALFDQSIPLTRAELDRLRDEKKAEAAAEAERQMMADLLQQLLGGGGGDINITNGNPVPSDYREDPNPETTSYINDPMNTPTDTSVGGNRGDKYDRWAQQYLPGLQERAYQAQDIGDLPPWLRNWWLARVKPKKPRKAWLARNLEPPTWLTLPGEEDPYAGWNGWNGFGGWGGWG